MWILALIAAVILILLYMTKKKAEAYVCVINAVIKEIMREL